MFNKSKEFLMSEANRCLQCKNARCTNHCPISTDVATLMKLYIEGRIEEAGEILFDNNPLSAVCSIVCPHEDFCKGNCIRGIKGEPIEWHSIEEEISTQYLKTLELKKEANLEERIAIIGSGPAGIALALLLARKGYKITIFERDSKLGGVLRYGIPEYRLPSEILDDLEVQLLSLGVKIRYNDLIGPVNNVETLFRDGYSAMFIGTGVWNPKPLSILGETLGHVHYAINYLKSPETIQMGKEVIVIGAGNVAMDAARTAKRNGARVVVAYRRGEEDMKATKQEILEAKEDGVEFAYFLSPEKIVEEGIILSQTETVDGKLVKVEGSDKLYPASAVVIAVSQGPADNIVSKTKSNIETIRGLVRTDENGHTTTEGVFASGDVVNGAKTVVEAVADTKRVAKAIDEFCISKRK